MSSANNTFGTASPPLEATGGQQPMGVSSIRGDKPQGVPDKQQRKGEYLAFSIRAYGLSQRADYFKNEGINTSDAAESREEDEGQVSVLRTCEETASLIWLRKSEKLKVD